MVGFTSDIQITSWDQLIRQNLVSMQPAWEGFADRFDPYLVEEMKAVYQEASVA